MDRFPRRRCGSRTFGREIDTTYVQCDYGCGERNRKSLDVGRFGGLIIATMDLLLGWGLGFEMWNSVMSFSCSALRVCVERHNRTFSALGGWWFAWSVDDNERFGTLFDAATVGSGSSLGLLCFAASDISLRSDKGHERHSWKNFSTAVTQVSCSR